MTALRVLPPDDYIGAVEAIPEIVAAGRRAARPRRRVRVDGRRLLLASAPTPRFGYESRLDAADDARAVRRARRRPGPPGQEGPAGPAALAAERPGEPSWDSPLGPGRPGWHVECAAIALGPARARRSTCRAAAATWSSRTTRCRAAHAEVLTGQWPFARHYVHAGHGRPRRREDVQVPRQPGLRVAAARRRRRPDGDPAGAARRTTTAPTGSGRPTTWPRPRPGWPAGAQAVARPAGRRRSRCWPRSASALADDLDAPAALAALDRWADEAVRGGPTAVGTRPGPRQSTPCSASSCDRLDPVRPGRRDVRRDPRRAGPRAAAGCDPGRAAARARPAARGRRRYRDGGGRADRARPGRGRGRPLAADARGRPRAAARRVAAADALRGRRSPGARSTACSSSTSCISWRRSRRPWPRWPGCCGRAARSRRPRSRPARSRATSSTSLT